MIPNSNKEREKGTRSCRQSFNSKHNEQAELIHRTQCHVQEEQIYLQQNAFHKEEFKPNNQENICNVPNKNSNCSHTLCRFS